MNLQAEKLIATMAAELRTLIGARGLADPVMIGIHTGGEWVAERLHQKLGLSENLNTVDINFYRDDFSRIGLYPQVRPSAINSEINDRHVILVDDVLHTGRTICAALNEIADYGRPATVTLAILIDRKGREMPIAADVCGTEISLQPDEQIKLRGPQPLTIEKIKLQP